MISLIGMVAVFAILICSEKADSINAIVTAQSQGISALKPGFDTTASLTGDIMPDLANTAILLSVLSFSRLILAIIARLLIKIFLI